MARSEFIRLFLCGDVMTGRGIDQILPVPSDPALYESYMRDARGYVDLAERVSGPTPRTVSPEYIWGDALDELRAPGVDARIINLETSITRSDAIWPHKGINYRMHPANIGCIATAGVDCCCLANNHVLDWGYEGLEETFRTLEDANLPYTGAGRNADEASTPAIIDVGKKGRVLVFAFGSPSSGIPLEWRATASRAGVNLIKKTDEQTAARIAAAMRKAKRPGDVLVVSIHWGSNWGYELGEEEIRFAHRLIEEGVDIVHGHSSHHPRTVELYHGGLVLYGCGDFLNDYEGIGGFEEYRGDLSLMYFADVDPTKRRPIDVELVPMQIRRFRLKRATPADTEWLCDRLSEIGSAHRTSFHISQDGKIIPSSRAR